MKPRRAITRKGAVPNEDEFRHTTPLNIRRVMVVGASGYLGSALALGLRDGFEVVATYNRAPFWIEGVHAVKIDCLSGNDILQAVQRHRPDIVLYCAGLSSAALCEEAPLIADALHNRAMALFFKVLPRPIPFLYFSCDQIFSSVAEDPKHRFEENDEPDPINTLGETKTSGENLVIGHNRLTHVMRLPRLYGERLGSPQRPRESWLQPLLAASERGENLSLVEDQWRSTAYIGDVVRGVRKFLHQVPLSSTIFHLGANDALSPYETAQKVLSAWGRDPKHLIPSSQDHQDKLQNFLEPRFSAMSSKRFEARHGFRFQSFDEGLQELRARLETGFTQSWI